MEQLINIVIPAAGIGTRFVQAGYKEPKPLIDVVGKPMLERVIDNLRPKAEHRFIIISRLGYDDIHPMLKNDDDIIIQLLNPTEGAVDTLLKAEEYLADDPLLIANCDQLIDFDVNSFIKEANMLNGALVTFKSSNPHHSYVHSIESDGYEIITQIAEKEVISSQAVAGIYYFQNAEDFLTAAHRVKQKNIRFNNEFYVSSVIAEMITANVQLTIYEAPTLILGTPQELQTFEVALRIRDKIL